MVQCVIHEILSGVRRRGRNKWTHNGRMAAAVVTQNRPLETRTDERASEMSEHGKIKSGSCSCCCRTHLAIDPTGGKDASDKREIECWPSDCWLTSDAKTFRNKLHSLAGRLLTCSPLVATIATSVHRSVRPKKSWLQLLVKCSIDIESVRILWRQEREVQLI